MSSNRRLPPPPKPDEIKGNLSEPKPEVMIEGGRELVRVTETRTVVRRPKIENPAQVNFRLSEEQHMAIKVQAMQERKTIGEYFLDLHNKHVGGG